MMVSGSGNAVEAGDVPTYLIRPPLLTYEQIEDALFEVYPDGVADDWEWMRDMTDAIRRNGTAWVKQP